MQLKKILPYLISILFATPAYSQYYIRGEVVNEKNQPLPYAKIFLHSSRTVYNSGAVNGSFGFITSKLNDSLTVTLEDYQPLTIGIQADEWQHIILKPSALATSKNPSRLSSLSNVFGQNQSEKTITDDETYFKLVENEFIQTDQTSGTGFSLNVNKASYGNVRRFINMGSPVPPDAVRVEELLNYFNLLYTKPKDNKTFNVETRLTSCPWNENNQLFFLNVSAKKINLNNIPPGNFVFLIDVSASMDLPNRLSLIKAAFQLFVKNIRPIDTISIVTYGEKVEVALSAVSGSEKNKILQTIDKLEASGETPGESGLKLAYQIAQQSFCSESNNRIILATDGDFNVGEKTEKGLEEIIAREGQKGIYLTCLGVGTGNFKDSKLQILAKKGNGNYTYLDNLEEAERVFVKELTQTLYAVADNAVMNIQFNPFYVKKYRLIGFDNNKELIQSDVKILEGGEIGSGSSVIALFEIVPTEENICFEEDRDGAMDIAKMGLTYNQLADSNTVKNNFISCVNFSKLDSLEKEYQFAAAISMFGLKIRQSKYFKNVNWDIIKALANKSANRNIYLQNEFIGLIEKSKKIYPDPVKRQFKKNRLRVYLTKHFPYFFKK
jgi:Ca-activated chloride channel family protein